MRHRLEKYPADFLAHFNLGALSLRRNDTASALDHLRAALLAEPEQPAALNTYGAALELSGKPEEAAVQFRRVLQIRPDDTDARYNLAGGTGGAEPAGGSRGRTAPDRLQRFPRRKGAPAPYGDCESRRRLRGVRRAPAGSDRCYREVVALDPGDADLHSNYGTLLARSGDLPAAIGQFEAALKLNPSHEAARRNLRIAQQKMAH